MSSERTSRDATTTTDEHGGQPASTASADAVAPSSNGVDTSESGRAHAGGAARNGSLVNFGYQGSLDGLRALAVLAIIGYHFDFSWIPGAYLSVDLFFIVSGFLITSLLIFEWRRRDRIALRTFWSRRIRRLLPALLLTLVVVAIFSRRELDPWSWRGVRNDGLASLFYVANWRFIADKQGYFGVFAAPSPLRHMWTLAIEEQFYIVWPIVVMIAMRLGRGSLRVLAGVCVVGIAASVAVMAYTYGPGDPLRAYYGTDARAHTILTGALLAIVLATWPPGAVAARRLAACGLGAFLVMLFAWHTATGTSPRYYKGGSFAYALLCSLVIIAAMQPGLLRRALAFEPLAWIGRLSYGIYLFHWPIIVWLVPTRVHIDGLALDGVRLGLTFALAITSFYLIELPIRERRLPTIVQRLIRTDRQRQPRFARDATRWLAFPATCLTIAVVLVSATGATPPPSYLVGERPKIGNFIWGYGDPLFCGTPRPSETKEAVDTARRLGAPNLQGSAAGLRVLLVGDSTACSFFPGMAAVGREVGADVEQASVFGCGVASGEITTTRNEQITPHTDRCAPMVQQAIDPALRELKPNVVVWMSLWEKSDLLLHGKTLVSGTPAGDAEMLRRMGAALDRLTAGGAKVVMVTLAAPAPNDAQGASNTSNNIDDASYARLDRIERRFAALHRDKVTLVDLARRVCPSGPPCAAEVDGVRLRPDGRHFTPEAAAIEARWLLPKLVRNASS
ncbi:MAG: acyltransferase [Actinomycetota bacterium]|nr:acyltransferase [Actinomycetota bacterium]